jgi:hypothetical protein
LAYELISQFKQISSCWGVVHSMVGAPYLGEILDCEGIVIQDERKVKRKFIWQRDRDKSGHAEPPRSRVRTRAPKLNQADGFNKAWLQRLRSLRACYGVNPYTSTVPL